jgi:hypothetical protein
MKQIFISHAEEDAEVSQEIARWLEGEGYSVWYYQRDNDPALSYVKQIAQAIGDSNALVLIISEYSMRSGHVDKELTLAYDQTKPIIPIRHKVTHDDFKDRKKDWCFMLGAGVTIPIVRDDIAAAAPSIIRGLRALNVHPGGATITPRNPEKRWWKKFFPWRKIALSWWKWAFGGVVVVLGALLLFAWLSQPTIGLEKTNDLFVVEYKEKSIDYTFVINITYTGRTSYRLVDVGATVESTALSNPNESHVTAMGHACSDTSTGLTGLPLTLKQGSTASLRCTVTFRPGESGEALQRQGQMQRLLVTFSGEDDEQYTERFCFFPTGESRVQMRLTDECGD